MKRFSELFQEIDRTGSSKRKIALLKKYFSEAPAEDAAWAVYFFSGNKLRRLVSSSELRRIASLASGYPLWVVEECYDTVGDLAETVSLLVPPSEEGEPLRLSELVSEMQSSLEGASPEEQEEYLQRKWAAMTFSQRFLFTKLLTGGLRVGVSKNIVMQALSELSGVDRPKIAERLLGNWHPSASLFQALTASTEERGDAGQGPLPFFLAYPLEAEPETLGDISDWMVEWKWDGIRAQLIRDEEKVLLWSRGEELVNESFPELCDAALREIPAGATLDGELLAWRGEEPLPFSQLQRRLNRKRVGKKLQEEVPVTFLAYDLLRSEGEDLRAKSGEERRGLLEELFQEMEHSHRFRLSPLLEPVSWDEVREIRERGRAALTEGVMIKKRESPYGSGRSRGPWWKWKVDPYEIDAVLLYAQKGHGKRADLFSDYTFAVWGEEGDLVPVAKAYSGLTEQEMREVDQFVRRNTKERFGPVRSVTPELVFELAFDDLQPSSRHRSGIALRFPRMKRWRRDKPVEEADSLETLSALLKN